MGSKYLQKVTIHGEHYIYKRQKECTNPLRNRIEAILKLEPPKMPKGCRSFVGMVIF